MVTDSPENSGPGLSQDRVRMLRAHGELYDGGLVSKMSIFDQVSERVYKDLASVVLGEATKKQALRFAEMFSKLDVYSADVVDAIMDVADDEQEVIDMLVAVYQRDEYVRSTMINTSFDEPVCGVPTDEEWLRIQFDDILQLSPMVQLRAFANQYNNSLTHTLHIVHVAQNERHASE